MSFIYPPSYSKPRKPRLIPGHSINAELRGCWPLGDGVAHATDIGPFKLHCYGTAPTSLEGSHAGGLSTRVVDASDNFLDNSASANHPLAFDAGDFSISVWSRANALTGSGDNLVAHGRFQVEGWRLHTTSTGGSFMNFGANQVGVQLLVQTNITSWASGVWYHYVMSHSGSLDTAVVYINGVECTASSGWSTDIPVAATTYPFRIGGPSNTTNNGFEGDLEGLRIWHRAITADEVMRLYTNPYIGMYDASLPYVIRVGVAAAGGGFQAAWARGSNSIIQNGGVAL